MINKLQVVMLLYFLVTCREVDITNEQDKLADILHGLAIELFYNVVCSRNSVHKGKHKETKTISVLYFYTR